MQKLLGVNWKTNLVGILWIGYGLSDLWMNRSITEFGFMAFSLGAGFFYASDKKATPKE